jgi:hypothetical protein
MFSVELLRAWSFLQSEIGQNPSCHGSHTDVFRRTDGRSDDGRGGVHDLDAL